MSECPRNHIQTKNRALGPAENLAVLPVDSGSEYFATEPASAFDHSWLVMSLTQLGRFTEATEHEAEALRLADSTQHAFTVGWVQFATSMLHPRRSRHPRQLRDAQDPAHSPLVGASSPLPRTLHPDGCVVDQPGRAVVRDADREVGPARRPSQHARAGDSDHAIHRRHQRSTSPVRLDEDGRRDPCKRRPILSSNL
jgi:hypothetical protein